MNCRDAQILLATSRDLSLAQRVELDAHMARCRACAAARRAEERTSRVLQLLPAPAVAPPPRVAAALASGLRARRAARALWGGLSLAGIAAAVLLLIGGVLGGRAGRAPAIGTGAALAPVAGPLLYLAHTSGEGELKLSALGAEGGGLAFSLSLGAEHGYVALDGDSRQIYRSLADVALSPDGGQLYTVVREPAREALVARDARSGAERWRVPFGSAPLFGEADRITLSPDGARVYLRGISGAEPSRWALGLRVFDAASGSELPAPPTGDVAADGALVLPLADGSALVGEGGRVVRLSPRAPQPPGAWAEAGPTQAAARLSADRQAIQDYVEYRSRNTIMFAPADGALTPDGRTAYLIGSDLSMAAIEVGADALTMGRAVSPAPGEKFFFDRSAFAADGSRVAVAGERRDSQSGQLTTEVRVVDTGGGRASWSFAVERRLGALALSPDGGTLYLAYSARPDYLALPGTPVAEPPPGETPQRLAEHTVLVAIDLASGQQRVVGEVAGRAVSLVVGR